MIYIATVHWKSERWIDIQLQYLNKNISQEFRIFTFLNSVPGDHLSKYYRVYDEDITEHSIKLNILADRIVEESESDEDIIIFLDGDAFPIGDITSISDQYLSSRKLIAVKRNEEDGEQQPHPCFCITTVGFWKDIKGDWKEGYKWINKRGKEITDVGGNMLGKLRKENINWLALERTNKINLHPVMFGIYGDIVYHHGAGFRYPDFRIHENHSDSYRARLQRFLIRVIPQKVRHIIPEEIRFNLQASRKSISLNQQLSDRIYFKILQDIRFVSENFGEGNVEYASEPSSEKKCIIVLGMHRSGTSCLMGTLRRNGVYTGYVNKDNPYNRRGTIEHPEVYFLNKEVLKYNKGNWKDPPQEIKWTKHHARKRDRLVRKISSNSQSNVWRFKDPRTIFTLPFWLEGITNYHIIATYRHPVQVANSLANRGEISLETDKGLSLWYRYNIKLINHLSSLPIALVSFDLPEKEYANEIRRVMEKIGILKKQYSTFLSFYDQEIVRANTSKTIEITSDIRSLFNKLNYNYSLQNPKILSHLYSFDKIHSIQ